MFLSKKGSKRRNISCCQSGPVSPLMAPKPLTNCQWFAYLHVVCKTSIGFDLRTADWLRGADRCRAANACIIIAQKRSRFVTSSLKFCKKRKRNSIRFHVHVLVKQFFGKHFSSFRKQTFNLTLWIADLFTKFAVERNSYNRLWNEIGVKRFFSHLNAFKLRIFWSFAI